MRYMMKDTEEKQLLTMVAEIYHHLGLCAEKKFLAHSVRDTAEKDVLAWKLKRRKIKT